MLKKVKGFLLLTIVLMSLSSCLKTLQTPVKVEPLYIYWGTKEEIKGFLDSPQAQSERWVVSAIK